MVIPAAGRAYNIPSVRDPKWWNLSIFLGAQPGYAYYFLPESWIFRFCEEYP